MRFFDAGNPLAPLADRTPARVRTFAVTTAAYVVLSVYPGRFVLWPGRLSVAPAEGVTLVATLLAGPVGAVGGALGYVLVDGVTDAFAPATGFGAVGRLLLGLVGYRLWWQVTDRPPAIASVRQAVAFVAAAVLGVMTATAVIGWGYTVFGQAPLLVATVLEFPGMLVATVGLGAPVMMLGPTIREYVPGRGGDGPSASSRLVAAVPVLWYVCGTGLSIVLQMYQVVPAGALRQRGLGWVRILDWGRPLQIGMGLVLFGLLIVALVRTSRAVAR